MGRIEAVTFTVGLMMSGLLMFASLAPVATAARQAASVELAAAPLAGRAL
jgi:hypothetical protein